MEGGAEFGGRMEEPDRRALALAGGPGARLNIIPAAAAPDNNHERAGRNGVRWFESLGATDVHALPLTDRESANAPEIVEALSRSGFIFLLGGFPHYLGQTLIGSEGLKAMENAYHRGAVIGGSSAGAMVLCGCYYDPAAMRLEKGLNLVPETCVIPHFDRSKEGWVSHLASSAPAILLIGIDEETGMINDAPDNQWQVYGKGSVTLIKNRRRLRFGRNDCFSLTIV